ncbi:MAG: hypothetical protein ACXVZQ_10770 [Terriglobales bacterium]
MKSRLRSVVSFLLVLSAYAQAQPPKYAVLKTEGGDAYLASVNHLSDQGYRVLIGGQFTILRLEATPPDTYRYLRLEGKGGPAQFSNWINDQGAHGYRWMASAALLEKAPHPKNYEYRNSPHGAFGPSKARELSSLLEEGYRPVASAYFSHPLGAGANEMYFEHEVGQPAYASNLPPGSEIQVADAMRTGNVMKHVDQLAKQGYRFLSPHGSNKGGGIAVMMEKCRDDCAGRYEYRYFDAKDAPQIERNLNALGHDGFQVLPGALNDRPHLLERDTRAKRTFAYRVLHSKDAAGLEHALNAADQEGYVPQGFVWHVGWSVAGFLVLEKETTASATPNP